MANAIALKTIGDWRKEIHIPMATALAVSMDVTGRTGEQACKHALILMARSAAKLTKKAKKRRTIQHDPRIGKGGDYVNTYTQLGGGRSKSIKLHRFRFADGSLEGTWDRAKVIGDNAGLAKRSWMWGLNRLGATGASSPISGASRVGTIRGSDMNGYIKENRLNYILKILPGGWERAVERAATNKIMKQAELKIERKFKSDVRRRQRATSRTISSFFKV